MAPVKKKGKGRKPTEATTKEFKTKLRKATLRRLAVGQKKSKAQDDEEALQEAERDRRAKEAAKKAAAGAGSQKLSLRRKLLSLSVAA